MSVFSQLIQETSPQERDSFFAVENSLNTQRMNNFFPSQAKKVMYNIIRSLFEAEGRDIKEAIDGKHHPKV